ncbi:hypothetical protein IWX90DRAFT_481961 [Phyllosticta citrichinensis]|uniref:Retrotransposon gag domain-containing protein n=1 Tax=Phyllosticta citrichinensis TaxID=1130410 RepID=A0ABR1Y4X2_9PEZI
MSTSQKANDWAKSSSASDLSIDWPEMPTPPSESSEPSKPTKKFAETPKSVEEITARLTTDLEHLKDDMQRIQAHNRQLEERLSSLQSALAEPSRLRLIPEEFGYFDHNLLEARYGSVNVVFSGPKNTPFHRSVDLFIEAAHIAMQMIPADVIRKTLHTCLAGEARTWYYSVLTDSQRKKALEDDDDGGIANWAALLRSRWGYTTAEAFRDLAGLRFGGEDLKASVSATPFVLKAVRIGRKMGMGSTYAQLALAYSRVDVQVQAGLRPPSEDEAVEDFINRIDALKLGSKEAS